MKTKTMNLRELEDFLETQEISFTSILKATKNLDPVDLKRSLTRHHAQMIKIAAGKYPIKGLAELSSPSPSPLQPSSTSKRPLTYEESEDDVRTPNKPKTPKKKTPTPSSSNRASGFSGRLQPAGASNLFKAKPSYTVSPSGFKDYIQITSSDEGSDSEFAEAKENSNFEGSDSEYGKKVPTRKGVAVRKASSAKKNSTAANKILSQVSDDSEVESGEYGKKKIKSNGTPRNGKSGANKSAVAVETDGAVLSIKKEISDLEASLAEKEAELTGVTYVLARQPILAITRELKQKIQKKKALLSKDGKSLQAGGVNGWMEKSAESEKNSFAATVEDASESDLDTQFKSKTATRDSASKRRRV